MPARLDAMEPEVRIRPGRPGDIQRIHQAILALAEHVGAPQQVTSTPADLMRHAFGAAPLFSAEIGEIGGEFAGMCLHFPIFSTWMGCPGVFVQDIYVEPKFRGSKVGEALLRHVARLSRAKGGGYLRLSVDTDNLGAQGFYNRLGIMRSEYEQIHRIMGDDFLAFCDGRRKVRPETGNDDE
jgi:ribosomal protein S18 acetylase RimI-like enzyme